MTFLAEPAERPYGTEAVFRDDSGNRFSLTSRSRPRPGDRFVGGDGFNDRMETGAGRRGPFWDMLAGRVAPPPAAELLGWELIEIDPDRGTIAVAFRADERFLNPVGVVQGGLLAAMLDDTLGPALVATLPEDHFAPTLDLHVQFLRPARPGRLVGRGRVVRRGAGIAFLAGELAGPDGKDVATATTTARIRRMR